MIEGAEKYANMTPREYWTERLANARYLLNQIDEAISAFRSSQSENGEIQSYTIDTGQDKQTVTRADFTSLVSWRKSLEAEIAQLERALGMNGSAARRIVPGY